MSDELDTSTGAEKLRSAVEHDLEARQNSGKPTDTALKIFKELEADPKKLPAIADRLEAGNSFFSSRPQAEIYHLDDGKKLCMTFRPGTFELSADRGAGAVGITGDEGRTPFMCTGSTIPVDPNKKFDAAEEARLFRDTAKAQLHKGIDPGTTAYELFKKLAKDPEKLKAVAAELEKGNSTFSDFSSEPQATITYGNDGSVVSFNFRKGAMDNENYLGPKNVWTELSQVMD